MSFKYTSLDTDDIINKYLAGKSIKQLASDNGFSRQVIYRILRENNVHIRGCSESMYVRMANTSPEERRRLASAAHEAKRGYINSPETLHKMALAKKKRIGQFEKEFCDALTKAGIPIIPQEPFLAYNLDIGCGDIAVEIHRQMSTPLCTSKKEFMKIMNCLHAGKSMLYVWIPVWKDTVTPECYEKVVSIVKEFRRNPPARAKYWVVWRTGEVRATGTFDFD